MPRPAPFICLAVVISLAAAPALAQITDEPASPYPDPEKFARGLYGEAELGALMFLGNARVPLGAGPAIGARVGYDLNGWAAVQLHALGSTHTVDFANAPQSGQLLQIYQGTGELRVGFRFGQLSAFGYGGAGLARLSTNVLGTAGLTDPDVQNMLAFVGGAGVDYHTLSRHFSFGLATGLVKYQKLYATGAISITTYVRYTF